MCGRFTLAKYLESIHERWKIEDAEDLHLVARYNLAPSQDTVVIAGDESGKPKIQMMKWGFPLPWDKDKYMVNVRAETLLSRPTFKKYLQSARCIIPADGFYEWKAEGKTKTPYRFVLEEGLFGIGGVYLDGKFCLITTEPNELVAKVHSRMPVIIPKGKDDIWLNPNSKQMEYVACLAPYPTKKMKSYAVSTRLNSAKNDTPDLVQPV